MSWGGALSHVADVGTLGPLYRGGGPWAGWLVSWQTCSPWPARGWSYAMRYGAGRVDGRPTTARGMYAPRNRPARHWPSWSSLKGRRWRNPQEKISRQQ